MGEGNKREEKRDKPVWRLQFRMMTGFFVIGLLIGIGAVQESELPLLIFAGGLILILVVAQNMPKDWMYTSFTEDRQKRKAFPWQGILRSLLPFGLALLAGGIIGWLMQLVR